MNALARERAVDRIARLAREPRDVVSFWQESTDVLASSVPYYWTPCWYTLDPASLLITSHFHEGLPEFPAEWLSNEYYGDEVNKLVDVARSRPASARCTRRPMATRLAAAAGSATCRSAATRS